MLPSCLEAHATLRPGVFVDRAPCNPLSTRQHRLTPATAPGYVKQDIRLHRQYVAERISAVLVEGGGGELSVL